MKKTVLLLSTIFLLSCNNKKAEKEMSYDDVNNLINEKVANGEAKSYQNADELVEEISGTQDTVEGYYYNDYEQCGYQVFFKIIPIKGKIGLKYIKVTEYYANKDWHNINPSAKAVPVANNEEYNYCVNIDNCMMYFKYDYNEL